jgi:hypothetical protein
MVGNPLFVNHVYYKSKGTKVGYGHQEVKCGCRICTLCNRGEHIKIHCFGQHGWDMFMHELLTKLKLIQSHCHTTRCYKHGLTSRDIDMYPLTIINTKSSMN